MLHQHSVEHISVNSDVDTEKFHKSLIYMTSLLIPLGMSIE